MTKFIVKNRTGALKTDINLFFTITTCRISRSRSLTRRMNFTFMCLSAYWPWKLTNERAWISAVIVKKNEISGILRASRRVQPNHLTAPSPNLPRSALEKRYWSEQESNGLVYHVNEETQKYYETIISKKYFERATIHSYLRRKSRFAIERKITKHDF